MKKIFLISAIMGGIGMSAFAQGVISINETAYDISAGGTEIGTVPDSYFFDVLEWVGAGAPIVSQNTDLTNPDWVDTGAVGSNGITVATHGEVSGDVAVKVFGGDSGWSQDTTVGTSAYFVIVGWSANEQGGGTVASWSTVETEITDGDLFSGYLGYSTVGNITAGAPINPVGSSAWQVGGGVNSGFNLGLTDGLVTEPAPEPATMALAGLGGFALLAMRRKK